MGVKVNFRNAERVCVEVVNILNEEIFRTLAYTCEEAVGKVRDRSGEESWNDDTGNLRSSIGYGIYEHSNKIIESDFPIVKNGSEGASKGKEIISDIAGLYPKAYSAVVIAGMDYAEHVENMENKDVLNNTFEWVESVIDERLQRAATKAAQRAQLM